MGTDIHGIVQVKSGDCWRYECDIEDDRNYLVFSILANVRNGYGFAGIKIYDPIVPIDEPRGLPKDLGYKEMDYSEFDDPKIANPVSRQAQYDSYQFGDHSQSWLYLSEILAWPHWKEKIKVVGWLEKDEALAVLETGRDPKIWCGGGDGPNLVKTNLEDVIDGKAPKDWNFAYHEWVIPISDRVGTFKAWLDYLDCKRAWILKDRPQDIRLVFGFDS